MIISSLGSLCSVDAEGISSDLELKDILDFRTNVNSQENLTRLNSDSVLISSLWSIHVTPVSPMSVPSPVIIVKPEFLMSVSDFEKELICCKTIDEAPVQVLQELRVCKVLLLNIISCLKLSVFLFISCSVPGCLEIILRFLEQILYSWDLPSLMMGLWGKSMSVLLEGQ